MSIWLIQDRAELQRLLTTRHRQFRVELPTLSTDDNLALERRLGQHYRACGCNEGAVGLLLGVLVSAVVWIVAPPYTWIGNTVATIALSLALSAMGKGFGLWRSRRALQLVLKSVEC